MCRGMYETGERFLKLFNPDMQYRYCTDLKRCYLGKAPTLSTLNETFGAHITKAWLTIQLNNLSEFSGAKEKFDTAQVDMLAKVIMSSFPYLKVTELMHFFLLFKTGKFGKFYGAVDGLAITESLRAFCNERREYIYRFTEQERRRQKEMEDAQRDREVAQFRELLNEYDITPIEWVRNQDLFKGGLTPEQIKAELKKRLNRNT